MPANPDLLNSPRCAGANASNCDNFALTVTPPPASFGPYVVEIALFPQGDWDVEVYGPNGTYLKGSGNGTGAQEFVLLDAPAAGTYRIAAFPFSPIADTSGTSYTASAQLKHKAPSVPATGTANVAYATFPCPTGQTCTSDFGEPSIGVNWKTGAVMFAGGGSLKTYRVTNFNDAAVPPSATWTNVGVNQHIATSPRAYADPILFTDSTAGRTFAGQLEGLTPFCTTEYTDDDGATWIPSQGSGIAAGIDHETYGGGPFAPPLTRDPSIPRPAYPDGVYYCAQSNAGPALCAISLDGGQTFGPSVPMWTTQCGGLHGHIKVSPVDGTAYVPNRGCTGRQGFAVSSDNGVTWAIRTVPGSSGGDSDPSIGIGADGTVYFGFADGDGHPKIAVTHDKGLTWDRFPNGEYFTDVGTPFGIQNSVFPAVVAGDANRAAFAFHGTPAAGAFQDASFNGVWNLYVASTFDGGKTWTTVKASPDPVQRGCIWLGGGSNSCRNLLDFFDASVDEAGRVVVGYADGCTGTCATNPASTAKSVWATIARQSVGKRMFARFDPVETISPGSLQFSSATYSTNEGSATATITVDRVGGSVGAVSVSYATSNGTATAGSDYTAAGGTLTWADGNASSKTFTVAILDDTAVEPSETVNLALSSPTGGATLGVVPSAVLTIVDNETQTGCTLPGLQVQTDANGDQTGGPTANAQLDLKSVYVAEPYLNDAEHSLTFTLKVANLTGALQPNSSWTVYFNARDTSGTSRQLFVQMNTTDLPSQANFSYGWHDDANNIDVGQCFANNCPQIVSGGYTSDGTITLKLVTTNALPFGDAATGAHVFDANLSGVGTVLSSIQGATSMLAGGVGTGLNVPVDDTDGGGSYTTGGNLGCKPNTGGSDPSCTLPGTTVTTDPAGDQTGFAQLDVQSLKIAEPYTADSDKSVTFTLNVANLNAPIPPNGMWRVSFTVNDTGGTPRTMFLQMDTTGSQNLDPTTPEFDYGYTGTSNTTQGNPNGAVTGSYTAAGAIVMKVKAQTTLGFNDVTGAHQFDVSLQPGMVLSNVSIASQQLAGAIGNGGTVNTDANTNNGGSRTYTLHGNLSCKPANPVTHYSVAAPSSSTPGTSINVTVTALDAANAASSGYRGTAHFTSSDAAASLPADYTFTAADAGAHTFSVTLRTAGAQTITATDGSITGTAGVTVTGTQTPTTTSLTSSPNPSTTGQAVTFTATVSPSTATGSVTFKDGVATLGSGTLSAGTATFSTSSLAAGAHSVTATYQGNATFAPSTSTAITQTVNQSLAGTPRFDILTAPPSLGDGWGEPSIGVNWQSERVFSNSAGPTGNGGTIMSFGGFGGGASVTNLGAAALRVTCSDCPSPADAVWEKTANLLAAGSPRVYGDPILFTDHDTGRTLISQLFGLTPLQSGTDATDDDGKTIIPTVPSGIPSGVDHQTIGGGPFHAPLPPGAVYKNAVYYCSQDLLNAVPANCSISLDGGLTWGPAVATANTGTQCGGGIHGHVKVGPDGTVYVPHRFCGATGTTQGLAISSTNGVTWTSSPIPGTADGNWDPSVAIGKDGAIYFGMDDHDRHPRIATSHNGGQTWSTPVDVGAAFHIERTAFPAVVAGDAGRAAFAFLGTPTDGDDQSPTYNGEWHLYLATTFDGGQTWSTSDLTPNDPVQRGAICAGGPDCTAGLRNLLDFFDATIDKEGRVLIGFADGCITPQCINGGPNDATAKNAIARQSGGKRMFAAFDPVEPSVPKAPKVSAVVASNGNHVVWSTPDHSGSPVTSFKLYKRTGTGAFNLLAVSSGNSYDDSNVAPGTAVSYRVTAINARGEGPYCGEATPVVPADSCHEPGILAVSDIVGTSGADNDTGQNTPPDPRVNIQGLYVAEPDLGGAQQLVFTLYVKPSPVNLVPPSTQWFIIWNKIVPETGFDRMYVAMKSDATGALSYEYGKVSSSGQITDPNINTPTRLGDADSGSYDPLTGKIRIVLSTSKAENAHPGQTLSALNVRTFYIHPDAGPRSQAASSDITDNGSYTLVGNCTANHAPVANGDSYTTAEDTVLTVAAPGVLANDTDADGNALTATLVSGTAHGTVALNANGGFTYTPAANYNGPDAFTYKANDGKADSNVATVSIAVSAVNDAPVASNDSYATAEDTALTVAAPGVLSNDTDVDGNALTAVLVSGPAHGTLTLNANGSFSYTPAANYNGADSFTYKANDGSADSNVATVSLTITAVNDPPVAVNDAYAVKPNATLTVPAPGVLANDGDVDSPSLTAVLVSGVSHGTLTLNADGSFTYTPATAYKGTDSFTYKANDGAADSNVATVTITVTPNAGRAAKVTGAGEVQVNNPDGIANFGFNIKRDLADGTASGQLDYYNSATGMTVKSTSITSLNISGTMATFSGTGTKNGAPCTFTVTIEDNGEPGAGTDRFSIAVSGEPVQGGGAPITSGNIQIH